MHERAKNSNELVLKNAAITFSIRSDRNSELVLHDRLSGAQFATIEFTAEQLVAAMAGLGYAPVESITLRGLDVVGLKEENERWSFSCPEYLISRNSRDELYEFGEDILELERPNQGWQMDDYFDSQDTFHPQKDGTYTVNVIIRRYNEPPKLPTKALPVNFTENSTGYSSNSTPF